MALITCSECHKQISDQAKICPGCGAPLPKQKSLLPKIIWVVVALGVIGSVVNGGGSKVTSDTSNACADGDLKCLGNKGIYRASGYCKRQIEKLSPNQFKWTDGALSPMMSSFQWKDRTGGSITYSGDRVQFQNESGAFVNMIYECDMSMDGKVIGVRAEPGRLK